MTTPSQRQTAALVEAGMALASELDLDTLLLRIANLSREVVGARYGAVGVLGEAGDLTNFVYSGIDEETARTIGDLPRGRGVLGVLIEEGMPLRMREISDHPRSFGFPEHHPSMHSFLGVPIVVRNRVFGRLYLTEKIGAVEFTKDDERIALTLASQAGVAIDNARLYEEVRLRSEELAVMEERDRIAKELHDGVIQSIYSVGLSLQGSLSLMDRAPELARQRIDGVLTELDNVVRDVRSYIFDLQPKVVRGRSLREAISELAKDLEVNTLADVTVEVSEDALGLDERQRSNLVQMVREVLSNIARHAQANEVSIACSTTDGYLEIEVIDDGVGFDPGAITRGHGLRNIEERAHRLGGRFDISPRRPRGTIHRISIPVVQG